jgi:hypothetical protein
MINNFFLFFFSDYNIIFDFITTHQSEVFKLILSIDIFHIFNDSFMLRVDNILKPSENDFNDNITFMRALGKNSEKTSDLELTNLTYGFYLNFEDIDKFVLNLFD